MRAEESALLKAQWGGGAPALTSPPAEEGCRGVFCGLLSGELTSEFRAAFWQSAVVKARLHGRFPRLPGGWTLGPLPLPPEGRRGDFLQLLQHRLGAGDRVFARLLDIERLHNAIFDQHGVALRADAHAFLDAIKLEADRLDEIGIAVAEHHDFAVALMLLAPSAHHKGVVDRDACDRIDALGLERGCVSDIARQMALRAGAGISAGHREQHDLLAAEQLVRRDLLRPFGGQMPQRHRGYLVAN